MWRLSPGFPRCDWTTSEWWWHRALWSHWRVLVAPSGLQPGRVLGLRDSTLQTWLSPSGAPAAVLEPISEPCKEKIPSPDLCRSHEPSCVSGIWNLQGPHCQHHPDFLLGAVEKRGFLPRGCCCAGCAHQLLMLHKQVAGWLGLSSSLSLVTSSLISYSLSLGHAEELAGAHGRILFVSGRPLCFHPESENRIYYSNLYSNLTNVK